MFSVVLKRRVKCTGRETAKNAADPRSFWSPTAKEEVRKGLIIMGDDGREDRTRVRTRKARGVEKKTKQR